MSISMGYKGHHDMYVLGTCWTQLTLQLFLYFLHGFTITFLKEVFGTFCLFLLTHQFMAMWLPVPLLGLSMSPSTLCSWFLNLQFGSKKLSWAQSLIPLSADMSLFLASNVLSPSLLIKAFSRLPHDLQMPPSYKTSCISYFLALQTTFNFCY